MPRKQSNPQTNGNNGKLRSNRRKLLDRLVGVLSSTVLEDISTPDKLWEVHLLLQKLLSQANVLEDQKATSSPQKARKIAIQKFLLWMKENGVDIDGVDVCEFEGYDLGVRALRDYVQSAPVLQVPRKLMLTEDGARKSALGFLINKDPVLKAMPNSTLAIYLLMEKFNADSFWKPYIDILPASYPTVLYFNETDMNDLQPSPVFKLGVKLFLDIVRQYAHFYKLFQDNDDPVSKVMRDHFTFKEYRWAVSTIMTRQNMVPSEEAPATSCTALIPLFDLCNHTSGHITTDFDVDKNMAECFALRDFKAGEQIFIFYGVRTNAHFFLHNGFVFPNNEHDSLSLSFGISAGDSCGAAKRALLQQLGLGKKTQFLLVAGDSPISQELLANIRITTMDAGELSEWSGEQDLSALLQPVSSKVPPELQRRALSFLLTRCALIMEGYRRRAEAQHQDGDKVLLPKRNQTHSELIKQLKECEVNILKNTIDHIKSKLS